MEIMKILLIKLITLIFSVYCEDSDYFDYESKSEREWSALPKNVMDFFYVPKKSERNGIQSLKSIDKNDEFNKKVIRGQIFDLEIGDLHKIGSEEEVIEPEESYIPREVDSMQMFRSLQDSRTPYEMICSLPKDSGNCSNEADRWYYDESTLKCEQFIYNGCAGNKNKFESLGECTRVCVRPKSKTRAVDSTATTALLQNTTHTDI